MKRHNGHGHSNGANVANPPPRIAPAVVAAGQADLQSSSRAARFGRPDTGRVLSSRITEALAETRASQAALEKYITKYMTMGLTAADVAAKARSGAAIANGKGHSHAAPPIAPNARSEGALGTNDYAAGGGTATGGYGVSIGYTASTTAIGADAIGANTLASGNGSVAVGGSVYTGKGARALQHEAIAVGEASISNAVSAVAIGTNSTVTGDSSVALGRVAKAAAINAVAIGNTANASGGNSIAIGLNVISNRGANTDGNGNVVVGANALVDNTGAGAVAIGRSAKVDAAHGFPGVLGTGSIAMGDSAIAYGNNSTAIGSNTYSAHSDSIALGRGAKTGTTALGVGNIAIGAGSFIKSADGGAIAIGRNATIPSGGGQTGIRAVALGDSANAGGDDSTAIGSNAQASQLGAIALGNNAKALTASGVAIGEGSLADRAATVSIGNKSSSLTRQLVNVKAGTQADDAVVVSQLQPVVTALGGGASIDPSTGAVTGPTYTLANGGVQTTLSGALDALDKALSDSSAGNPYVLINSTGPKGTASGSNGIAIGQEAYALGNNSVAIGMSSMADQANTFSVGNAVAKRKVVSVAAGDVSAASSDAIVGSQLYATNQAVDQLKTTLDGSGLIDPGTGESLAVTYSSTAKNTIMLGNAGSPVEIMNVADALVGSDAVNLNQLTRTADALRIELGGNVKYLMVNSTGAQPTAAGVDAVALGASAIATMDGTLAFGLNARASAADAVALGSNSLADAPLSISVGNQPAGLKRRIVNMEAGVGVDDAVNISQLQPMVTALGGGAAIDPATGAVTGPTYTLANGGVQTTLEGALSALDTALSSGGASNPYLAVNSTGPDALAGGSDAIGIGSNAIASGGQSVALGAGSVADQDNTISLGNPSLSRKIVWMAAGDVSAASMDAVNGSQLYATDQAVSDLQNALTGSGLIDPGTGTSLAVTYSNAAKNIVLMGNLGTPVEIMNVATGVAGTDAVNLDQLNTGLTNLSNQFANNLKYVRVNATGTGANAGANDSVAIGSSATSTVAGAVAIGTGARASSSSSVAIGQNSVASQPSTVSVGNAGSERKIVNVAAGDITLDSTDAINGSQLYAILYPRGASASRASILDVTNPEYAVEGVQSPNLASLNGGDPSTYTALAVGVNSTASGSDASAFGLNDIAQSDYAVAIGSNAQTGAGQPYSIAIGSSVYTNGTNAVAMGANVQANADNAVAIGTNNTWAVGVSSIAIGDSAKDRGVSGIVVGKGALAANGTISAIVVGTSANVAANVTNAIALGTSASVSAGANGGVALGQGAVANRGTAVSLGNTSATPVTRQIINLSAGTQTTDAVNVSQLQGVTNALGGGAAVAPDGSITPPSYTIDGTAYPSVSTALTALASMAGTDPNAVAYDSTTKDTVTLGGSSGTVLTNLNAGAVNQTSMDAINGAQLYGTANSLATRLGGGAAVNPDGTVSAPVYVIDGAIANDVGTALDNVLGAIDTQLTDAGLIDASGRTIAAVTYDSTSKAGVTLGGTGATAPVTVSNAAAGALSSTSTEVVNGSQLYAVDQAVSDLTNTLNGSGLLDPATGELLAVTYADTTKTDIALGTPGTPVAMTNLADGALSSTSADAVNGSQLYAVDQAVTDLKDALDAGGVLDPATGESLAVTYADASKADIALGVTGTPVTVSNVEVGDVSSTSTEAINGSQLYATNQAIGDLADAFDNSGIIDPATGESLAVVYADASKADIALGTTGTPVTVSNAAPGALSSASTDVVNGAQLYATNQAVNDLTDALESGGVIDPATGESLAVTYADASKTGIALGTTGTPVTMSNVAPGALSSSSNDVVNGSQLYTTNQAVTDLKDTLDSSGLLDPATGQSLAVVYDDTSKDGVTLGGAGAAASVPLHNMATGTADTDGVNVAQLTSGLSAITNGLANGTIDVNMKYIKVNSAKAQANATGTDAVCIGPQASASAINAVAIGRGARVPNQNSVAIGVNSVGDQDNVLAVGSAGQERKIIHVLDGDVSLGSSDAVTGNQLYGLRKALDAITGTRGANGVKDVVDPLAAIEGRQGNNVASLNGGDAAHATAAAIGAFSTASGAEAIAVGLHNLAGSDYSVALGYMAQTGVDHDYSVAVGAELQTNAKYAAAFGTRVQANGDYALAMGSNET